MVKNRNELQKCISNLLINRQNKVMQPPEVKIETPTIADKELKEFKELLDSGVITKEDFDAKKKQILGL